LNPLSEPGVVVDSNNLNNIDSAKKQTNARFAFSEKRMMKELQTQPMRGVIVVSISAYSCVKYVVAVQMRHLISRNFFRKGIIIVAS